MLTIGLDARYIEDEMTGLGRLSFNLIRAIADLDRANRYIIFVRPGFSRRIVDRPNMEQVKLPFNPVSLRTLTSMPPRQYKGKLDILHVLCPLAPPRPSCPLMITVNDLQPFMTEDFFERRPLFLKSAYRRFYHWLYPTALRRATRVVAISGATKRSIIDLFGTNPDKIAVIHCGRDKSLEEPPEPDAMERVRRDYELPPNYLFYPGSGRPQKNFPNMLRAFSLINTSNGFGGLQLIISGRECRFKIEIDRTIKALGLEDRVRHIGYVPEEDLHCLYQGARALLYVTRHEGFGFPLIEARAGGTPTITSTDASLPEVAGDAALLVAPEDVTGIAGAIERVLEDKDLRRDLIGKGYRNIERFSWQRAAAETIDLYREVAEGTETNSTHGTA